jgi:signal transduction histidine kinase
MAKKLVQVGVHNHLAPFRELFLQPNAAEIIETASQVGKIYFNISNIGTAIGKVTKMLLAIKNYSRKKQDEAAEEINILESLETVLTIYHNQLKYGVEVTTDFAEGLPSVMGYPDELTQVWTNVLHNAIQAMEAQGSLHVCATPDATGSRVVISFTDSGPGVPPEIQEKIFQPFFTTKPLGQGTGLGLDICRQIVQKHGGTIGVESQPGRTTFRIELPIRPVS